MGWSSKSDPTHPPNPCFQDRRLNRVLVGAQEPKRKELDGCSCWRMFKLKSSWLTDMKSLSSLLSPRKKITPWQFLDNLVRMVTWPFQSLNALHLGDHRVTLDPGYWLDMVHLQIILEAYRVYNQLEGLLLKITIPIRRVISPQLPIYKAISRRYKLFHL